MENYITNCAVVASKDDAIHYIEQFMDEWDNRHMLVLIDLKPPRGKGRLVASTRGYFRPFEYHGVLEDDPEDYEDAPEAVGITVLRPVQPE